jgi:hypothetical protein
VRLISPEALFALFVFLYLTDARVSCPPLGYAGQTIAPL